MELILKRSQEIVNQAIADYKPYAIVMMFSGGHDSLAAYHAAKALGMPITHFMHGITGTGVQETTDFARRIGERSGLHYIEPNAGNKFDEYVLRKGFFGIGEIAHEYAYHILKHQNFRSELSRHIRQRKRGRNILLLNGARYQESARRSRIKNTPIRQDEHTASNIWVNVINDWSALDRNEFIAEYKHNPVYDILHRSGECLCGTMQYPYEETRREVSYWFPAWGKRMDTLEKKACERGFCWGWGEDMPDWVKAEKRRQKQVANGQKWLPMCQSCIAQKPLRQPNKRMNPTTNLAAKTTVASQPSLF